ncbi:MAG: hypothetical protein R3C27_11015 [Hyphomonadaceae bacterium]
MIGRVAIVALAMGLAGCAGLEPAGRNARSNGPMATTPAPQQPAPQQAAALPPPQRTPAPTPQASQTPQPAPQLTVPPAAQRQQQAPVVAASPPPQPTQPVAPPVAAPNVSVAPPAPVQETSTPARARSADEDIVVPGQVQNQVRPPVGDPRTNEERRADIRSWDQCVMQVQSAFDSDPMSPQLTTPEEYCSSSLGMTNRTSVPIARQGRRR